MREIDRDILLASTGELPWRRRIRLALRLRRDADARRTAETLSALSALVPPPAPAAQPTARPRLRWALAAGGALAACALAAAVAFSGALRPAAPPSAPTTVLRPAADVPPAPLYQSTSHLLLVGLASVRPAEQRPGATAPLDDLAPADAPPLPPWSYAVSGDTRTAGLSFDWSQ